MSDDTAVAGDVPPFRGSWFASFAAVVESSSVAQCGWWWIWFIEWEQIRIHVCGLSHTSCQDFVIVGEVIILIEKSSAFHRFHFKHNFHVIVKSLYLEELDLLFDFYTCAISHTMILITCFFTIPGIFINLLNISQSSHSLCSIFWMYTWRCYFRGYRCTKREVTEPALFPSSLFTVGLSHSL